MSETSKGRIPYCYGSRDTTATEHNAILNTVCRRPLQAGLPHLMDPVSLDTLSESRMGGQITTNTFAAHYRILDEGVEVDGEQREHRQQQQPRPVGYRQDEGMSLGEMWMRHHAHAHTHAHPEVRPGPQPHSHVASTQHTYPGAATPLGHFGHQQQQHHQQGQAQQQQEFRRHHRDGSGRQRLVTFSNEFSFTGARAVFYEFDEDGRLLHRQEHMLEVGRRVRRGRAGEGRQVGLVTCKDGVIELARMARLAKGVGWFDSWPDVESRRRPSP